MECADERLDDGPSDGPLPSLRLNVDNVETEFVFADHTVDAAIPTGSGSEARVLGPIAVPHRVQHVEYEVFERRRRHGVDALEQLDGQSLTKFLVGGFYSLLWRRRLIRRRHDLRHAPPASGRLPELFERGEL